MSLFANYVPFKNELEQYVGHCQDVFKEIGDTTSSNLVSGFIKDLDNLRYNITIVGSLNRGKSTLLNTLMERSKDDISPISTTVCTSAIIKYLDKDLASGDKKEKAILYFNDPEKQPVTIPHSQLRNYVTEEKNPENRKQIKSVEVYGDFPAWSKAVTIIDSPGQNSVFAHHDTLLSDFLPYTDAIIFLVSADIPLDGGDITLLKELSAEQKEKIFFVLTKIDNIEKPEDLADVKSYVIDKIAEVGIICEKLYAVSARPVYQGLRKGLDPVQIETLKIENGIAELEDDLERFIVSQSDQTHTIRARIKGLLKKTSLACNNYIESSNRLVSKQDFDLEQIKNEQTELIGANQQLRDNTRKSLRTFEREWKRVTNGFSRKFANRADAVEDRIRDSLERGGLTGAVFHSFKLKKQVGKAVALEMESLVIDMESKLEDVVSTLNQEFDDELFLYVKRKQGTDFCSVAGSFVATAALGGTAAMGVSATGAAVSSAMSAYGAWQSAVAASTLAKAAYSCQSVGALAKFWSWLTGWGSAANAAREAATAAATATNAGTAALTAGISAVVTGGIAFGALMIVQKIAHVGLVNWQGARVPGLIENIMADMENKLFKSLDGYKESIVQEYQQNIENIISDREERISEIQNLLANNDPAERQFITDRITNVKNLLCEGVHIEKQIPLLDGGKNDKQ